MAELPAGPWHCHYTSNHAHDYRISNLPVNAPCNDHSEQRLIAKHIEQIPEMVRLFKSICADIDAMRQDDTTWFGAEFEVIDWPNLAIVRDEIKQKLGI